MEQVVEKKKIVSPPCVVRERKAPSLTCDHEEGRASELKMLKTDKQTNRV